jgi:SPP1 family predicted phage head-tail adaptor
MIYSGNLTETLEFYDIVERQSESGYKQSEEVFMFKVRAERLKNKMTYTVDADELFHATNLTFRLRYRREIKDTNIVVYEGERYRILSIDKYQKDNQMTIIIGKINE